MTEEVISPERFAILVEQAGLRLTPEQFEELRQAYPLVERMARTVRRPRDRAAEPAHIFVQPKEGGGDGSHSSDRRRSEPRDRGRPALAGGADRGLSRADRRPRRRIA